MIRKPQHNLWRRGAVTVEFAIMAPVLVTIFMGMTEASRLFEVQNQLNAAAREGARMAAMERTGAGGTNTKVTADIKNYLKATGLDPEKINIQIVDHSDPSKTFNLDDPANSLKYFEVNLSVPYSATSSYSPPGTDGLKLNSKMVFRNIKIHPAG
jgi:Flp pilus assembly protein TadG